MTAVTDEPDRENDAADVEPRRRRVRSFVRREGRLTPAQSRALENLWPVFGIEPGDAPLDFSAVFDREAPVVLEIGFGNGRSLAALAADQPQKNFVGLEVHRPGVGQLLLAVEKAGLTNVRVICDDAVEVLERRLSDSSIDELLVFFPDPWPKKRHHKRRMVQPAFLELAARRLRQGGILHLATDWEPYAEHMFDMLEQSSWFENTTSGATHADGAVERPHSRPVTKYETRGRRLGHGVWDFVFVRR